MSRINRMLGLGMAGALAVLAMGTTRAQAGQRGDSFLSLINESPAKLVRQVKSSRLEIIPVGEGISSIGYGKRVDENSSWEDITAVYQARFPMISFGTRLITIDSLCVSGDTIRPVNPVRVECVEWAPGNSGERDLECIKKAPVFLSTPIRYTRKECVEWKPGNSGERDLECAREAVVSGSHKLTRSVEVYQLYNTGEGRERLLFRKDYTIGACKSI